MLKRSILLLSALFVTSALAQGDSYFFIQIANDGVSYSGSPQKHPKVTAHKLSYFITTPAEESISNSYSPAAATIDPQQMNSVYISRADTNTLLTAHLKVTDPEAGGRIVWEGDISEDLTTKKIYDVVSSGDYQDYAISSLRTSNNYLLHVGLKG